MSKSGKSTVFLTQLRRLDNQDWVPPAMLHLSKWAGGVSPDPDRVNQFLTQLERLAFGMHVLRAGINQRIEKYGKILAAIEDESETQQIVKRSCHCPRGQTRPHQLLSCRRMTYMIRVGYGMLFAALTNTSQTTDTVFDYSNASIEHVLPQNPRGDSEWVKLFTEQDRDELTGCLGNLVLLSGRKNSAASNKDFAHKKDVYFAREESLILSDSYSSVKLIQNGSRTRFGAAGMRW